MDLLYRMPASLHCSHKRAHSPSSNIPRHIFKKKKRTHDLSPTTTTVEPTCERQDTALSSISIGSKPKANYNSKNDVVRINDMDAFLAACEEENSSNSIEYTLLRGDENKYLMDVKLKDGSSIPMERRAGETKLRIPDFVLKDLKSTSVKKDNDNNYALIQYQESLSSPSRLRSMTGASNKERTQRQDDDDDDIDEGMMDVDHSNHNSNNEAYHNQSNAFNKDDTLTAMEID